MLAAGVGVRHGWRWMLRSASFRVTFPPAGGLVLGVATARPEAASALVSLLSGHWRPAYGELRVLGEDLTTAAGRAAVRRQVGVARRLSPHQAAFRVRGLVEHAARAAQVPAADRQALVAAIIDRMQLTPWAQVPLRSAPPVVARRARLAAAAVHEPALLLVDGLLDRLAPQDAAALADGIRELSRDSTVIVAGCSARALRRVCGDMLMLADGVLVGPEGAAG
ncbi:MAG: hypothetical protein ACLQDY_07700 [Streptosporangiaceae bacterium]